MKIKQQLSITTVLMAGAFVTGCSQQQIEGGSQVAGASQQQVEEAVVAAPAPAPAPARVMAAPAPAPVMAPKPRRVNRWGHTHPAIPRCTDSIRHTHKYNSARHSHKYSCRGAVRHAAPAKPAVDVYALQRKLKAKGYYKGPIDGVVGPGTRTALKRFMNR